MKTEINTETAETVQTKKTPAVAPAATCSAGWLPFNAAPTHGGSFLAVYMIGEKIKSYHMAHWDFDLEKFTYHPGAVRKPTHWHPIPIFEPNTESNHENRNQR